MAETGGLMEVWHESGVDCSLLVIVLLQFTV
jgi:hypothetical protein